jgi:hypothetical protein
VAFKSQYSVASFAVLRVLNCLYSPGLCCSYRNVARFCMYLAVFNLVPVLLCAVQSIYCCNCYLLPVSLSRYIYLLILFSYLHLILYRHFPIFISSTTRIHFILLQSTSSLMISHFILKIFPSFPRFHTHTHDLFFLFTHGHRSFSHSSLISEIRFQIDSELMRENYCHCSIGNETEHLYRHAERKSRLTLQNVLNIFFFAFLQSNALQL